MKAIPTILAILILSTSAAAQAPKFEVFGGYSVERIAPCGKTNGEISCGLEAGELATSTGYFHGWNGAATIYVKHYLGITADVAGHYGPFGSNSNARYSFLFGPTFALHKPVFRPFVHSLFGLVRETAGVAGLADTAFTKPLFAVGGGVDVALSHRIALRPAQVDYEWQKNPTSGLPGPMGFRLSAGIVAMF